MNIPPESIQVGQRYLTKTGKVCRVLTSLPNRIQYEQRNGAVYKALGWQVGILDRRSFAFMVERPVPCNWTPETDQ
jgi:hypothetical protein